jgi:hypothetical protein
VEVDDLDPARAQKPEELSENEKERQREAGCPEHAPERRERPAEPQPHAWIAKLGHAIREPYTLAAVKQQHPVAVRFQPARHGVDDCLNSSALLVRMNDQ